jgi:hypothetical protein
MAYSVTPTSGVKLDEVYKATDIAAKTVTVPHKIGQQVFGDDGRLHVFVKVGSGGIAASQTDISVNATTFVATDGSGSYVGQAVATVENDYCWVSKASV